jgi:Putative transposase
MTQFGTVEGHFGCRPRRHGCLSACCGNALVFTIPKRLRIYFRFDRRLLGELCRAAARAVITIYRAASGRPDALPGIVGAIQTFGQLAHWHPHVHALVSEGVFVPETGHLLRYYGWYSNKSRGQRAKTLAIAATETGLPGRAPKAREARKGWAALIKRVCECPPLLCPRCGSEMRIIAFIERHQTEVIEKILRHCGLWEEGSARGPPAAEQSVAV